MKNTPQALWSRTERLLNGCLVWTGPVGKRNGYGKISWGGRDLMPHRVAWIVTHGAIPESMAVCHRCDNRLCVEPGHLFLGTRQDNSSDMVSKQRQARGVRHAAAKLDDDKVREIRSALAAGDAQREVGKRFGVSQRTILFIAKGQTWRHVA